jgi:hypothetical protein
MSAEDPKFCLLWQRARNKGHEKGLNLTANCPNISECDGNGCIFIDIDKIVRTSKGAVVYKAEEKIDVPVSHESGYPYEW